MSETNDLLNDAQVAELLGCDTKTVQEETRSGTLPGIKFGRSWRYPRSALMLVLHELALSNRQRKVPAAVSFGAAPRKSRRSELPAGLVLQQPRA